MKTAYAAETAGGLHAASLGGRRLVCGLHWCDEFPPGYRRCGGARALRGCTASYEDTPSLLSLRCRRKRIQSEMSGNISFFHYDRSVDSDRVVLEVHLESRRDLGRLLESLSAKSYDFQEADLYRDEVQITTLESVLNLRVKLVNRPGSLGRFARLLKEHRANVIYMLYDEDIDPEVARIALAVENAAEIDTLLESMNNSGYCYKVVYRGSDEETVEYVIGLKLAESFFLRLRKLLADRDLEVLVLCPPNYRGDNR